LKHDKERAGFYQRRENAETFRKNFAKDGIARVPEIKWTYTTRRVLTMEYVEGIQIDDLEGLEKAGIDKVELARNLATSICNQILTDGFYQLTRTREISESCGRNDSFFRFGNGLESSMSRERK